MNKYLRSCITIGILFGAGSIAAHGLIQEPASRNWLCGAVTKPDQADRGEGPPVCRDAFADTNQTGYQFMSVLTHARGRAVVTPLPKNVCGFDSETWNGGATPWDKPLNWPAVPMRAGRNKFTWNISWGPHFDDTEEFRYWITKPGFQYTVGQPLKWSDFEDSAFCVLKYDDKNPSASPDIVSNKGTALFDTYCNVPARSGRHVIYGEWGRNQFTLERFHGCVDVAFSDGGGGGGGPVAPTANIALTPSVSIIKGAGSLSLSAAGSTGTGLQYQWSISSPNSSLYSLENATSSRAKLNYTAPSAATSVLLTLLVRNSAGSDSTTVTLQHDPATAAIWSDLGAVSTTARTLKAGDTVRLRVVDAQGVDRYYPIQPLVLNANNAQAAQWPLALANAVNALTSDLQIGVLATNSNNVAPVANATANRVYALADKRYASAFIEIVPANVPPPPPPSNDNCVVKIKAGGNPYWAGLDVGFAQNQVTLDFAGTGIDLSRVRVDGVFTIAISGNTLRLTKPAWVTPTNLGHLGISGNNYSALASFTAPTCK